MRLVPPLASLAALLLTGLAACDGPADPPGPPATLTPVGATDWTAAPGSPVADSLVVRLTDQRGNPVSGATVAWSGDGVLSPASSVTGPDGVAKARWTLAPTTAFQQARAVFGTLAPVDFSATPSAPSGLTLERVSGSGQAAPVNTALAEPLVVRVLLPGGVPLEGAQVAWTATSGTLAPATSTTGADGVTQATWTLGGATGSKTATASSGGGSVNFGAIAQSVAGNPVAISVSSSPASGRARPGDPGIVPVVGHDLLVKVFLRDADFNYRNDLPLTLTPSSGTIRSVTPRPDSAGIPKYVLVVWTLGTDLSVPMTLTVQADTLTKVVRPVVYSDHTLDAVADPPAVNLVVGESVTVAPRFVDQYGNEAHGGNPRYYVEWTIGDPGVASTTPVIIQLRDSGGSLYHPRVTGEAEGTTTLTISVTGTDTHGDRVTYTIEVPVTVGGG